MVSTYAKHLSTKKTPQSAPIPGSAQVKNSAGGYVFKTDDWARLERWLVLGSEGGSYYAGERKLTMENAECVLRCIAADGARAVATIEAISYEGRAPKNDQAVFALALAIKKGDLPTRQAAARAVPRVCRTGTHLFQLAEAIEALGGWGGRVTARAVASWYNGQSAEKLAVGLFKYQQRNGWSHKDLLRLSHAGSGAPTAAHRALYRYVMRDGAIDLDEVTTRVRPSAAKTAAVAAGLPLPEKVTTGTLAGIVTSLRAADARLKLPAPVQYAAMSREALPKLVEGIERAKRATTDAEVAKLVHEYVLPRECIPTERLNSVEVWDALLRSGQHGMPITALIRNLGKMTSMGLIKPLSDASRFVVERLGDVKALQMGRVHPMALLIAQRTYEQGRGVKGKLSWLPVQPVVDALDKAFYAAFKTIEPTGKRYLLGLDISGSMDGGQVAGSPLTPREASAAMALVTMNAEPQCHAIGFTSGAPGQWASPNTRKGGYGYAQSGLGALPLKLTPRMRLKEAVDYTRRLPMGGTDCALPVLYAQANKLEVDVFVTYTDNETWAGDIHPTQALRQYREATGINAKMIAVGMVADKYSIVDPTDAGSLDVVGFDSATPQVISAFSRSGEARTMKFTADDDVADADEA